MKAILMALALVTLSACTGLPKLSVTPVDAELTVGGEHETEHAEDNMVKTDFSESSDTRNEIVASTVSQIENNIQEYPRWLILAFAMAVGLAVPSPLAAWSSWRQRRMLEKQIVNLSNLLAASQPTSTTKPVESLASDGSQSDTSP